MRQPIPSPAPTRLLRIEEFAELLGVSKRKVFALLASGSIPTVRLGNRCRRIQETDAVAWIAARRQKGQ